MQAPNQTTGQLRARLQRLIISIDPASARDRYQRRVEERRVITEQGEDGTANLMGLHLPPADTNAAMRRINHAECPPANVTSTTTRLGKTVG